MSQSPKPGFFEVVAQNKVRFFSVFFIIFTLTYAVFFALDFLPEAPSTTKADEAVATSTPEAPAPKPVPVVSEPVSMTITELSRTVPVLNPASNDIPTIDAALLNGVARHPDSAKLGEDGNILILGHSSYLPNVMNRNYQAFNGIQKLKWGDTITVSSDTMTYTYRVDKVYESRASDVIIPTDVKGKRLTLVTCNSFGAKEDRFIVEATLISEKAL